MNLFEGTQLVKWQSRGSNFIYIVSKSEYLTTMHPRPPGGQREGNQRDEGGIRGQSQDQNEGICWLTFKYFKLNVEL